MIRVPGQREREREERRTQHRSHGCLLGPSGTDPRTASVRTFAASSVVRTTTEYSILTSQSDGIHTVCYRMLPNRGESSSVVTKPRDYRGGWSITEYELIHIQSSYTEYR